MTIFFDTVRCGFGLAGQVGLCLHVTRCEEADYGEGGYVVDLARRR